MSLEKNRMEAERWFRTAEGDLDTAVIQSYESTQKAQSTNAADSIVS